VGSGGHSSLRSGLERFPHLCWQTSSVIFSLVEFHEGALGPPQSVVHMVHPRLRGSSRDHKKFHIHLPLVFLYFKAVFNA
jgi:hypothetical protein